MLHCTFAFTLSVRREIQMCKFNQSEHLIYTHMMRPVLFYHCFYCQTKTSNALVSSGLSVAFSPKHV